MLDTVKYVRLECDYLVAMEMLRTFNPNLAKWSKSLPSVGYSRKSYLQVTSQKLARDKLVHLHGRRSLALPSVGSVSIATIGKLGIVTCKMVRNDFAVQNLPSAWNFSCFPPCIPDLLMAKDFKASVLHVSELFIALPWIPNNSPQSRIALVIKTRRNFILWLWRAKDDRRLGLGVPK
ncbi:hypothetical protein AAG906_041108 [Vitis piasezkii]